jgi:hypothetical protein
VLLLLPPSEGKAATPRRGKPLDLDALSFPELTTARRRVLTELVALCADRDKAVDVLGLTPGLAGEVDKDAGLLTAPTLPASALYTGVLYDALSVSTLDAAARRRATRQLVVVSALFGALRMTDRVPSYRLSMDVALPGAGPLASLWREPLAEVLPAAAGNGLVVDLRSATYAAAWRPDRDLAPRTVAVRVLREEDGKRSVVSHMAKHTRGEVARHLLETGAAPRTPEALADALSQRWTVELPDARRGAARTLDVVLVA